VQLKILFLCTGNSCRNQIAEGWARKLKSDSIEPYSAGIKPHDLDQIAVKVMAEVGVDISNNRSKHLNDFKDVNFDLVITTSEQGRDWFNRCLANNLIRNLHKRVKQAGIETAGENMSVHTLLKCCLQNWWCITI
jgi:protein-tyrosine-phosphatase